MTSRLNILSILSPARPGLVSWLMSLMGIDSTCALDIYSDYIESSEGSLSGHLHTVIPFSAMDTATCGFTKPLPLILVGIGLLFMAFSMIVAKAGAIAILLLLAVGAFAGYYLKRCLVLYFSTMGASVILFPFKRSVIEGIEVDENFAKRVCDIVKRNYVAKFDK